MSDIVDTIQIISNKLYVNWIDVIPVRMDEYKKLDIYNNTVKKYSEKNIKLIMGYIDAVPGLCMNDIYNTIANNFYYQIVNCKWLIFDIISDNKLVGLLNHLESNLHLNPIWEGKLWSHLLESDRNKFNKEWNLFKTSKKNPDQLSLFYLYDFMIKNYSGAKRLIKQNFLHLISDTSDVDEDNQDRIDTQRLNAAQTALQNVPTEDAYIFLSEQLNLFKKSWYYYSIKIKNVTYPIPDEYIGNSHNINHITPKIFVQIIPYFLEMIPRIIHNSFSVSKLSNNHHSNRFATILIHQFTAKIRYFIVWDAYNIIKTHIISHQGHSLYLRFLFLHFSPIKYRFPICMIHSALSF